MFKSIANKIPRDTDLPDRAWRLDVLERVINGCLYDNLAHPFHAEKNSAGEYIPLRERRPCVRYALCRIVVDDSVSMLFSEGHFPAIDCADNNTRDALSDIIKDCGLNLAMIESATIGSVGSVAIFLRVLNGRVFVSPLSTKYLSPLWKNDEPDTLRLVIEEYKVSGRDLRRAGYDVADNDLSCDFWFRREWDESKETRFLPRKVSDKTSVLEIDESRTVTHGLGFVPVVWVKNLPGGDDIDGAPTFPPEAIDTQIEIDYQLSQAGRGLKYSSDPTLLIKEPALGAGGEMVKGGGNAIVVGPDGDAKMLEINGSAASAVLEYVRELRKLALESAHGNRADADKLSAAQSGRSQELMNQALVWLADRLRISYGEGALLDICRMIVAASQKIPLRTRLRKIEKLNDAAPLSLRWPAWYAPTSSDKNADASTLAALRGARLISQETAIAQIAPVYDISDPADERKKLDSESAQQAQQTI